jgi:hypothetical protein
MSVSGNGSSQYLVSAGSLTAPTTYSYSFWYAATHIPGTGVTRIPICINCHGSPYIVIFCWDNTTSTQTSAAVHLNADNSTVTVAQLPRTPAANVWGHYAVTWDGTNLKAYLNGDLLVSVSGPAGPNPSQGNPQVNVLALDQGTSDFDNGSVGEFGIWNIALAQADVNSLFTGSLCNTVQNANLIFYDALNGAGTVTGPTLTNNGATFSTGASNFAGSLGGQAAGGSSMIAGATYSFTPTGGSAIGGSSFVSGATFHFTPTGGPAIGGSSFVVSSTSTFTMSGGLAIGGDQFSTAASFSFTMDGGQAIGGNAMVIQQTSGLDGAFVIGNVGQSYTTR